LHHPKKRRKIRQFVSRNGIYSRKLTDGTLKKVTFSINLFVPTRRLRFFLIDRLILQATHRPQHHAEALPGQRSRTSFEAGQSNRFSSCQTRISWLRVKLALGNVKKCRLISGNILTATFESSKLFFIGRKSRELRAPFRRLLNELLSPSRQNSTLSYKI
jgi:hypothetical protein